MPVRAGLMRSICDNGMLSRLEAPTVTEPTRTPSISSMVWLALAPRRQTDEVLPGAAAVADLDAGLAGQQVEDRAGTGAPDLPRGRCGHRRWR